MHRFKVGNQAVMQVQTYLILQDSEGSTGLVISGTASPTAFDDAMPMFKKFIDSFEALE